MFALWNVGSLVLGILAWFLPAVNLLRYDKMQTKTWTIFTISSLTACAIALCFQIIYIYHLVQIGDWTALMDITGGIVFVSTVLLSITILLNVISFIVYRRKVFTT